MCETGYMMRLGGDAIWLEDAYQGWCTALLSGRSVADGSWHFVVGVFDRRNSASKILHRCHTRFSGVPAT